MDWHCAWHVFYIAMATLTPVCLRRRCLILSDHAQIKTFHEDVSFAPVHVPPVNEDGLVKLKDEG